MIDLVRGNDLFDAVRSVLTDDLAPTAEHGLVVFGGHARSSFLRSTAQRPHAAWRRFAASRRPPSARTLSEPLTMLQSRCLVSARINANCVLAAYGKAAVPRVP